MKSHIFNDAIVKNSSVFAKQLKRLVRSPQDEKYFLDELIQLEKQRFAFEITKRRKDMHLSQSRLASKVGTTQAVISRMEQGKVNFGFNLFVKLRTTLGTTI